MSEKSASSRRDEGRKKQAASLAQYHAREKAAGRSTGFKLALERRRAAGIPHWNTLRKMERLKDLEPMSPEEEERIRAKAREAARKALAKLNQKGKR